MAAPVRIDALSRDDLAALVRMAQARGFIMADGNDIARARCLVLEERARACKAEWEGADDKRRELLAAAEEVEDNPYRRDEYAAAANDLSAQCELVRTLHRIWQRADDRAQQARREVDHLYHEAQKDAAA